MRQDIHIIHYNQTLKIFRLPPATAVVKATESARHNAKNDERDAAARTRLCCNDNPSPGRHGLTWLNLEAC
jgi:hypothetical protein